MTTNVFEPFEMKRIRAAAHSAEYSLFHVAFKPVLDDVMHACKHMEESRLGDQFFASVLDKIEATLRDEKDYRDQGRSFGLLVHELITHADTLLRKRLEARVNSWKAIIDGQHVRYETSKRISERMPRLQAMHRLTRCSCLHVRNYLFLAGGSVDKSTTIEEIVTVLDDMLVNAVCADIPNTVAIDKRINQIISQFQANPDSAWHSLFGYGPSFTPEAIPANLSPEVIPADLSPGVIQDSKV